MFSNQQFRKLISGMGPCGLLLLTIILSACEERPASLSPTEASSILTSRAIQITHEVTPMLPTDAPTYSADSTLTVGQEITLTGLFSVAQGDVWVGGTPPRLGTPPSVVAVDDYQLYTENKIWHLDLSQINFADYGGIFNMQGKQVKITGIVQEMGVVLVSKFSFQIN